MNLTKEQVSIGVRAGLELLGDSSNISIPARLNDGIFVLKQILFSVAQGRIVLSSLPDLPEVELEVPEDGAGD